MSAQSHSGASVLEHVSLPERYRIVRGLARGGMASVWCADDLLLGRRVAIKLLAEQFVDDPWAVRRFQREARTAARLSGHPNVVTIFDVGQAAGSPGRPFIVMEHLAGGTVADAIRVGPVRREEALRWLGEAAAALDYAHGRGVIHRDVKPGNMLLDPQRTLHVADFGIARIGTEDTITSTGQLFGTAAYISPEQALGHPATDASDRYALAVVAFELLTGRRPFTAEHFAAQARAHVEHEPPPATSVDRGLPPAIDAVLARGMAKAADRRFATATAFAEAVEVALASSPATARIAAPPRPVRSNYGPPRRQSRAIALAGLATVAFGVGAAIGASSDGGAPGRSRAVVSDVSVRARPASHPTHRHSVHAHKPKPAPPAQTTQPTTTTATAAAATTTPPTSETLEARGHQLMLDGDYAQAIGVLHQAVSAAPSGSLTYAYALYDLGRSLRLAGDPAAAVPVLQRRLQIPNQTDVVRQELGLALQALGGTSNAPSGGAPAAPSFKHAHKPGRGHHGHDGGD
jgi:eukaryotic-like serine/threonine-protein kinase